MPSFSGVVRNAMTCGSANAVVTSADAHQAARLTQRQSQLYPADRLAFGFDAEVLQLPAYRGADADALLRKVVGKNTVKDAWNDATEAQRHDKLRALLMLVDEHDIKQQLATPLFNSPMHQTLNKPGLTDAGLSAVIKEYPYYSSKPTGEGPGEAPKNLNGKGVFSERSMDSAKQIVCRHLAIHQTEKMNESASAKFNYQEEFNNVETIQDKVQHSTEQRCFSRMFHAPEVHVVNNAKFGKFISGQFTEMESAGEKKKTMFLGSNNHAMSLGLRIKVKNGETSYVTKFYDPNQTNAHARSATGHLNTFETKSIDDFLSSKSHAKAYYPKGINSTVVCVAPPAGMSDEAAFEKVNGVERKLASRSAELDVSTLYHLGQLGFGADLRDLVPEFNALPDKQKVALLSAEVNGRALLESTMEAPTGKAVSAYAELLNTVPSGQRATIVGIRNETGMNTVGTALTTLPAQSAQLQDFPSVLAKVPLDQRATVIDTTKITTQPIDPRLKLFAKVMARPVLKRHGYEESGLVAAVKAGDCAAIHAYGELIKMVPIDHRAGLVFKEHMATIYQMGRDSPNKDAGKEYERIANLDNLRDSIFRTD